MPPKRRKRQTPRETVTDVIDGDTFKTASRPVNSVRLANVNAPEKGEPGYGAAKRELKRLIGGKLVTVERVATDKYGRTVAKVHVGEESVNKNMRDWLADQKKK